MTVLTKPILTKPDGIKSPLVIDENYVCDEEKVDVYPPTPQWRPPKRSVWALMFLCLTALLMSVAGVACGLLVYRQYLRTYPARRYQGFCAIPIDTRELEAKAHAQAMAQTLIEPNYREHRALPPRFSDDVQLLSTADESATDNLIRTLREELEIGDRVEKIRVFDNGRTINFVHDFDDNITGIVDSDRCFMMDLDPDLVLQPDLFVFGIEGGGEFDVTSVHSTMRAILPAMQQLAHRALMAEQCASKPVYRLQREDGTVIRKRAVDAPPHDYIQFAGKHVQQIEIANLADLLQQEQNAKV